MISFAAILGRPEVSTLNTQTIQFDPLHGYNNTRKKTAAAPTTTTTTGNNQRYAPVSTLDVDTAALLCLVHCYSHVTNVYMYVVVWACICTYPRSCTLYAAPCIIHTHSLPFPHSFPFISNALTHQPFRFSFFKIGSTEIIII